jgi:hypothetical protein
MSDISQKLFEIASIDPTSSIGIAVKQLAEMQAKEEHRKASQRERTRRCVAKANVSLTVCEPNVSLTVEAENTNKINTGDRYPNVDEVYIYNTIPSNSVLVVEESKKEGSKKKRVISRAREAEFQIEFDGTIWPMYPNKVSKKDSLKAYCAAREKVPLQTIADGLQRYISTKPEYQDWSHLATWLNKERWEDVQNANRANKTRTMAVAHSTSGSGMLAALGRGAARVLEDGLSKRSEDTPGVFAFPPIAHARTASRN